MATLQIDDIDDRIYERLKQVSRMHRRSIGQEVAHIIESYLSNPYPSWANNTDEFLRLAGSWNDERSAEDMVSDLRNRRTQNRRNGTLTKPHSCNE